MRGLIYNDARDPRMTLDVAGAPRGFPQPWGGRCAATPVATEERRQFDRAGAGAARIAAAAARAAAGRHLRDERSPLVLRAANVDWPLFQVRGVARRALGRRAAHQGFELALALLAGELEQRHRALL